MIQEELNTIVEEGGEEAKIKAMQKNNKNLNYTQGFDPHFYSPQVHLGRSIINHGDLFGINP